MEARMARTGRPKAVLVLDDEERDTLARWARRPSSPQSLALRSKIVLACAEGKTNQVVAAEVGCSAATVGKWRSRFVAKRLKGLADEHRSGVPRSVTDDHVEAVIVKTLTEKPHDATHWSTRGMARSLGMSQPTVSRIWKAFGLNHGRRRPSSYLKPPFCRKCTRHRGVVHAPARAGGGDLR